MDFVIELVKKYKSIVSYLFFGVCTTLINLIVYYICYNYFCIANVPSVIIAWLLAVMFAFVTNKVFVFESKRFDYKTIRFEISTFFSCRLLTGILDVVVMYMAVDVFDLNSTLWKLLSNMLVIVLNYIASKLVIFKKAKK